MDSLQGITFWDQRVTPADDGILHRAILPDCILTGCAFSSSGSTLTMSAGYLMVCGRQIGHPSSENWPVVGNSGVARLTLVVDIEAAATVTQFGQVSARLDYAQTIEDLPALQHQDINAGGTLYEAPLCYMTLGAGGICSLSSGLTSR